MEPADLSRTREELVELIETVVEGLAALEEASQGLDPFLGEVAAVCSDLSQEIETTSLTKAGLESLLSAYAARYPAAAETMEDAVRFRGIVQEKEERLAGLEDRLTARLKDLEELIEDLDRAGSQAEADLARLDEALVRIKEARLASRERLDRDRAKVESLLGRFSRLAVAGEARERINLPPETIDSVVDDVLDRVLPPGVSRQEVLSQVADSIVDEELKRILAGKLEG